MPLVTTDQVMNALNNQLSKKGVETEVYSEFPSDEDTVSEGIYVARLYQSDREVLFTSMANTGSSYKLTDTIEMYLIHAQQDPYVDAFLDVFAKLIDDPIFKLYSPREYKVEQVFQNNSERYRIIFSLTRHQLT